MIQKLSCKIGKEELVFETGRMAKQANGAVYATYGGSAIIATACASSEVKEGLDFVPVTVEYNEKFYAAGKIPGGFVKREGRPKDREILVSRIIDRPMRPLFYKEFGRELQVVPTVVSFDGVNPPDVVGIVAASAAVHISDIPFNGPIAGARVCLVDGEYIINPTFDEMKKAKLEIVVAGSSAGITMVEGHAEEASEEEMLQAIEVAKKPIADICALIDELRKVAGKEKLPLAPSSVKLQNAEEIRAMAKPLLEKAVFTKEKLARYAAVADAISQVKAKYSEQLTDDTQAKLFGALMEDIQYHLLRSGILDRGLRVDGRGTEDIRPITCEIGVLNRAHGSALFTRGETQSLGVATLGTVMDEQIMDDIEGDRRERFMLHYNFPPFSVGEVGRLQTGRREIGHGNLARRAIEEVLPPKDKFPYTIRVVSEILESNGSSSMASVCSGTLALLAAGVPLKMPVAGIAMGLITEGERYAILSDILGDEDHLGDMDFKVAGSTRGITGFQMDIKIAGVSTEILTNALQQAKRGRLHILGIMEKTIAVPAAELSVFAPKIVNTKIDVEKIGAVIGPGGKNIKALCEKYGVTINVDDDGSVTIYGADQKNAYAAKDAVLGIAEDPIVGTVYDGVVKRVMDFGAFIEILPGKEGLCHISRLSKNRVENVSDIVHEGDVIKVKLLEVDRLGRLNLAALDALDENGAAPMPERRDPPRDRDQGRGGDRYHDDKRSSDRGSHRDDSRRR